MPPPANSPSSAQFTPLSQSSEMSALVETCRERSAEALLNTRTARDVDVSHAIDKARSAEAEGIRMDLLQALAIVQGHHEEHVGKIMLGYAEKISETLAPVPELIPFAGKLIVPSAFYESFEQIFQTAIALLVPVIYVEDTDSMGVASINPIAAAMLAPTIQDAVYRRFGIRPFLTVARMDYESWSFLTRKHFSV
jgi:hypothetical protein